MVAEFGVIASTFGGYAPILVFMQDDEIHPNIPRSHYEQIDAFTYELQNMIVRFKLEWDLPLESIVGAMDFVKNEIVSGDYSVEFIPDPDFWDEEEE